MIIVIEGKNIYPGFAFDPTAMQMRVDSKYIENRPGSVTLYDDVTLTWKNDTGLKAIETLLGKLGHYEQARTNATMSRLSPR
ncbi:MAG: hypothetical protein ACRYGI_05375 [Janthinobacterium lividum]